MQYHEINDVGQLETLVTNYYGNKVSVLVLNCDTKTVRCILYESFVLELSLGERYGEFGASIEGLGVVSVLGRHISLNSDEASIKSSLDAIDHYCRLRLPDKFLTEFERQRFK